MTIQFVLLLLVFGTVVVLLAILFLMIMGVTNLDRTAFFIGLEPFIVPIMIVVSIVGCAYIGYRFMRRPLDYLDEVAEAAKSLAHPTEAPIEFSANLKDIEDSLNDVREKTLKSIKAESESERRKDDLLVYLAHDLKTPLTSVIGYLSLMEDESQISPELISKYTGIARKKAEHLEELINEFFEITRLNTNKLSIDPKRTNLSRMLTQIANEFNPILTEKDLEWNLQIPEGVEIICDSYTLERAIDNLIRNALNYGYTKSIIKLTLIETEEFVSICIQNNAPTIPPEKLERIFEQFYRINASRSTDNGGAGLGLSIAKEIVELHRGTITVASEDEVINFTVQLPKDCQKIV